jgi:hypothetical protein
MGMAVVSGNWVEIGNPNDESDLENLGLIDLGGV